YPQDRLDYMIENSQVAVLLTQHHLLAKVGTQGNALRLCLDTDWHQIAQQPEHNPDVAMTPRDRAYMIYTSGSTGLPKGAIIRHDGAVNHIEAERLVLGFNNEFSFLQTAPASSDISVWQFLGAITCGGKTVILDDVTHAKKLFELVQRHHINLVELVPVALQLLMEYVRSLPQDQRALPSLNYMMATGEAVSVDLVNDWLALYPQIPVVNAYGPTEAADDVIQATITQPLPATRKSVPIGQPLANLAVYILDDQQRLVPPGVPGEICIGGIGVGEGYWHNPEKTAAAFMRNPFSDNADDFIYRTGDLGRWLADGSVEYLDRVDNQVKVRGFRIELGEVQACLERQTGVQRCVVMVREDRPGDPRLVAYLVTDADTFDSEALRDRIRRWLPEHMVPSQLVPLAALPVLPNGKVDRAALPRPAADTCPDPVRRQPPRSETERLLWQIWQDLLQRDDFGVDDSFFDLGGHSMLAVRMLGRLDPDLRARVPLNLLFGQPTIAAIARHLETADSGRDRPLVVLRTGSQPQGLFLLAGARMYQALAQQLDIDMPVYGLFSQAEIDLLEWPVSQPLPALSVESLADSYLQAIRARQPHGPYHLGGFSIGGIVAYEVAQRLRQQGEEVALLVMLDCALPGRGWSYLKAGLLRRWRLFRQQGWRHLVHLLRQARALEAARTQPGGRRNQAYAQAIRDYRATPSAVPVAFFQAAGDPASEPAYGWPALVSNISIERVPGRHMDILEMPQVAELAQRLGWHLTNCTNEATNHGLP
ncbi:MAG: amino acid adenylation domain-containing protein, partial [Burkholderiales bacterium]